jgi:hypothetical protein
MQFNRKWISSFIAAGILLGSAGGCETMKENPRTTGTIGGAAIGAGAGALIDHNKPVRGALIGAAVGGVAGNIGGAVYKDGQKHHHDDDE